MTAAEAKSDADSPPGNLAIPPDGTYLQLAWLEGKELYQDGYASRSPASYAALKQEVRSLVHAYHHRFRSWETNADSGDLTMRP